MENHIIIFLALLWACFAVNDSTPNLGHRNLAPGNMKDVCVDLRKWGKGNCKLGHHTLDVAIWKQRWFHKFPEVTLGRCKTEDELPHCANKNEVAYCRWFGSTRNGMYCTMYAPRFFGPWLESVGAFKSKCTSRIQGDMIKVEYRGSGGSSGGDSLVVNPGLTVDTEIMCMDVEGSDQTLEVTAIRDVLWWLDDEDDYIDSGECGSNNNHDDLVYSCAKLPIYDDNFYNWFLVHHDDSLTSWLSGLSDDFRSEHCDAAGISYDQLNVIEMYYRRTRLLCMENNNYWHTLEVTADQGVINWLRDDYADQQEEGECDPPDDYDETNSHPVYYCVDLDIYNNGQDEAYLVDTDSSLRNVWEDVSVTFRNNHCDNNGINYGDRTITMLHHSRTRLLCMENNNYWHTLEVTADHDVIDWLRHDYADQQEEGECDPSEYYDETNSHPVYYCVDLDIYNNGQDEAYLVHTDSSLFSLWNEVSDTFRNDHCDNIGNSGINYGDRIITMLHHEDDVICIEFDFDDVSNERHTVVVKVTPSSERHNVLDWLKDLDLNGNSRFVGYNNCSPDDDEHEPNQGQTTRCARLDGLSGWWDIESYDWFDGFWEDESIQFRHDSCSGIGKTPSQIEGMIKFSHK